jgi:hypothetical protein
MGETLARNWEDPGSSFSTAKLDIKTRFSKLYYSFLIITIFCNIALSVIFITPSAQHI